MPIQNKVSYHSNGKLLLTSEYFVLDGALALALPTLYGQSMTMQTIDNDEIKWKSYTNKKERWFLGTFKVKNLSIVETSDKAIAETLQKILQEVIRQKGSFESGFEINTTLEFPRTWGLGSSSTLLHLIAQWTDSNPYELLKQSLGGSGYDIACAGSEHPIFYQLKNEQPFVQKNNFNPPYSDQLYFVFLGKKQNSRDGINYYRKIKKDKTELINRFSELTNEISETTTLKHFETLIEDHERLVSENLNLESAKSKYFENYPGKIKSLGAWGGDFILATSEWTAEKTKRYFNHLGFDVFFKYNELIKNNT